MLEGVRTFRSAALGEYRSSANDIERMREEVNAFPSSVSKDKKRLREDRKRVAQDMRAAHKRQKSEKV